MLKTDTQDKFLSLTEIMARYPGQVIVSKDMHASARLRGRRKGMKKRLTDGKRTGAIRKWLRTHDRIKRGEKPFHARIKARNEALAQFNDMVKGVANFYHDLKEHAQRTYTANELAAIGRGEPFTQALKSKVVAAIKEFAERFFNESPYHRAPPPPNEMYHSFIFRFALCAYLHALHWIAQGGAPERSLEKIANDLVDVTVAAFGTCFDGVLTNDKFVAILNAEATELLRNEFLT